MSGQFLDPLQLEYLDGRHWKILAPFRYHLGTAEGLDYVAIAAGAITDFASIPQVLWNVLPPTGPYGKAAVVHDELYATRIILSTAGGYRLCDRSEADRILNEAMAVLGVSRFTRWLIYSGVRVGGWKAWERYRALERADLAAGS